MTNKKGMALVTTLVLSLIALILLSTVILMIIKSTNITGSSKRYATAVEAAKGASDYIINAIFEDAGKTLDPNCLIHCNNDNSSCIDICPDNSIINLPFSKLDKYNINAKLIRRYSVSDATYYSVQVETYAVDNTKEKAFIQFIYKIE